MSTSDHTGSGAVSGEAEALRRENDELRAYLKAFCRATIEPDDNGRDAVIHEANPTIVWTFRHEDEQDVCGGRFIMGGQIRRAMELVGYDKLKIEPAGRTIADDLAETDSLRREVRKLRGDVKAYEKTMEAIAAAEAAPRSDRPLTGTPEAGGDLGELARLSEVATQGEFTSWPDRYEIRVCRSGLSPIIIAKTSTGSGAEKPNAAFLAMAGNYVRKLLSASSSPAAAGGADREAVETIQDAIVQARGALTLDSMADDDGSFFGTTVVALKALCRAESAILALTPRPAGPGAQAQSPDLGADGWQPIKTALIGEEILVRGGLFPLSGKPRSRSVAFLDDLADLYREDGSLRPSSPTEWHPLPPEPTLHPLNPAEAPTPESEVRTVSGSSVGREG